MFNEKKMIAILTPKESNVYSPNNNFLPMYDSKGVECGYERHIFYKHAIPSGWISQTNKQSNKQTIKQSNN